MIAEPETRLSDGVVALRHWRRADAPAVFAACQDPLIARFVPIPQPYELAHAQWFVDVRQRDPDSVEESGFAIVDAETDELFGAIARHGPFGHRALFGWAAPPPIADRGRMTTPASFALIFSGLLLVAIGLFVAGNLAVVGLGVTALFGAGILEAISARRS